MSEEPEAAWHLDKRVPLAIIFTMVGQVVAVVWAVSRLYSDVSMALDTDIRQDARLMVVEAASHAQAVSGATVNAQLANVIDSVGELKVAQHETTELLRRYLSKSGAP